MAFITYRDTLPGLYIGKGDELTFRELDDNFYNLNTELAQKSSLSISKIKVSGSPDIVATSNFHEINLIAGSGIQITQLPQTSSIQFSVTSTGNINIVNDDNSTGFIPFVSGTGNQTVKIDTSQGILYNASTNVLTARSITIENSLAVPSISAIGSVSLFNDSTSLVAAGSASSVSFGANAVSLSIASTTTASQTINLFSSSTQTSVYNIAAGATASSRNKTVNIGTGGLSGSITDIQIGAAAGSTTINSQTFNAQSISLATGSISTPASSSNVLTTPSTITAFTNATTLNFGYQGSGASTTNISVGNSTTKIINIGTGTGSTTVTVGSSTGSVSIPGGTQVGQSLSVGQNLSVLGKITQTQSIIELGGPTAHVIDDAKDSGVSFRWFDTSAKQGFFGLDDSTGYFTFVPNATITNGIVSGQKGIIDVESITGSAARLTTPRIIELRGDVVGQATFDGSGNIVLNTVNVNSSAAVPGNYVAQFTVSGNGISMSGAPARGSIHNIALSSASNNMPSSLVYRDAAGNFSAGTITANVIGNSDTASRLKNSITISLVGDVTGNIITDGGMNSTAQAVLPTVNQNPGVFGSSTQIPVITVNGKGLVTSVSLTSAATDTVDKANRVILTQKSDQINYPIVFAQQNGISELYIDSAGGTYNPSSNTASINISGDSSSTGKLRNPITINFSGDAQGNISSDFSQNITTQLTLPAINANVGSFGSATQIPVITVNSKGLVTQVSTTPISISGISDASRKVILTSKNDSVEYPLVFAQQNQGESFLYADTAGGTYNPSTNTATLNIIGNASTATTATTAANATRAQSAAQADFATNANQAQTANSATTAQTANFATTAGNGGVTAITAGPGISINQSTGNVLISALAQVQSVDGATGAVNLQNLASFARTLSGSGSQRFPGGFTVKWGQTAFEGAGNTTHTVTFNGAFTQCFTVIVGTVSNATASQGAQRMAQLKSFNSTGFTWFSDNLADSPSGNIAASYIAIGIS